MKYNEDIETSNVSRTELANAKISNANKRVNTFTKTCKRLHVFYIVHSIDSH